MSLSGRASQIMSKTKTAAKQMGRRVLSSKIPYGVLHAIALRNDPVTILVYHTLGDDQEDFDAWTVVRIGEFKRQIAFLQRHYDIISLDEAVDGKRSNQGRPRAVITFDDGERGLHTHLLPFIKETKIPVTVYVATGQIETGEPFWFDEVMNAVSIPRPLTIDLRKHGLKTWTIGQEKGPDNWLVISDLLETLKAVCPEERAELTRLIIAQAPAPEAHAYSKLAPLSMSQLIELSQCPFISLQSHTHCHSLLDQIPLTQAIDSIAQSKHLIEKWTRQPVIHFAYPNGNYNRELENTVQELGFRSATVLDMKLWHKTENLCALPRVAIGRYDDIHRFKLRLLGL